MKSASQAYLVAGLGITRSSEGANQYGYPTIDSTKSRLVDRLKWSELEADSRIERYRPDIAQG